jgi:hypothetical protein
LISGVSVRLVILSAAKDLLFTNEPRLRAFAYGGVT